MAPCRVMPRVCPSEVVRAVERVTWTGPGEGEGVDILGGVWWCWWC